MEAEQQKIDIFTFLRGMTIEKKDFDFDDPVINKEYNQHLINRFVSMIELFLPVVNEMNKMRNLDNRTHYEFYKSMLPKKNIYFKYMKKTKEIDELTKKCIMKYYDITKRECEMYIQILSEKQIKDIVAVYNKDQLKDIDKEKF